MSACPEQGQYFIKHFQSMWNTNNLEITDIAASITDEMLDKKVNDIFQAIDTLFSNIYI